MRKSKIQATSLKTLTDIKITCGYFFFLNWMSQNLGLGWIFFRKCCWQQNLIDARLVGSSSSMKKKIKTMETTFNSMATLFSSFCVNGSSFF